MFWMIAVAAAGLAYAALRVAGMESRREERELGERTDRRGADGVLQ